jgi:hypothetical protein
LKILLVLQPVNGAEFLVEVFDVGAAIDLGTSDPFHQFLGLVFLAMAVNPVFQPGMQFFELTFPDLIVKVGDLFVDDLPNLEGDEVTEGVGGEVAEIAKGPVNVLEDSFGVVLGGDAEIFFETGVPYLRQVFDLEFPLKQTDLNFEAEHDVEVVGGFIGFNADGGRLDFVDGFV